MLHCAMCYAATIDDMQQLASTFFILKHPGKLPLMSEVMLLVGHNYTKTKSANFQEDNHFQKFVFISTVKAKFCKIFFISV